MYTFLRDHGHCSFSRGDGRRCEVRLHKRLVKRLKTNVIRSLPLRAEFMPLTCYVNYQITFNETFPLFGLKTSLFSSILTRGRTLGGQLQTVMMSKELQGTIFLHNHQP